MPAVLPHHNFRTHKRASVDARLCVVQSRIFWSRERETGFEPATSSLGTTFGAKRFSCASLVSIAKFECWAHSTDGLPRDSRVCVPPCAPPLHRQSVQRYAGESMRYFEGLRALCTKARARQPSNTSASTDGSGVTTVFVNDAPTSATVSGPTNLA